MNKRQKQIIALAVAAMILMLLFPPMHHVASRGLIGFPSALAQQGTSARQYMPGAMTCVTKMTADRRLDPIRGYLPEYLSSPTSKQKSDPRRPTAKQKDALIAYDEQRHFCENLIGSEMDLHTSRKRAANWDEYAKSSRELRSDLLNGTITFGQFVTQDQQNLEIWAANDRAIQAAERQADIDAKRDEYDQQQREQAARQQERVRAEERESRACQAAIARMRTSCSAAAFGGYTFQAGQAVVDCQFAQAEVKKFCY